MKTLLSLFALILILPALASAEARSWTSVSGDTLQADFVRESFGNVYLKTDAGKIIKIHIKKLSEADRTFLKDNGLVKSASPVGAPVAGGGGKVSEFLQDLLGEDLTDNKAKSVKLASALNGKKKIAFYFSASWCPPCRTFTPVLIDAYNEYNKDGGDLAIILVGNDRTKSAHRKYLDHMPWLGVEHESKTWKKLLEKYSARGIPHLVVIDDQGKVLSSSARGPVTSNGAKAFESM